MESQDEVYVVGGGAVRRQCELAKTTLASRRRRSIESKVQSRA